MSEWRYFLRRSYTVLTKSPQAQAELVAERVFPDEAKSFYRDFLVKTISEANPKAYRRALWSIARFNKTQALSSLKVPVLVISGREDTTIPLQAQEKLAAMIPGARQVVISGGGHGVNIDQPEVFNDALLKFLGEHQAS
jgi:3-oxoadipate enol-lactonase